MCLPAKAGSHGGGAVRRTLLAALLLAAAPACSGSDDPGLPPGTAATTSAPSSTSPSTSTSAPTTSSPSNDPFSEQFASDPRTPVTWLVKPTGDARTDEALATYRHLVFAVARVFSTPNPNDAELLALTSGQARKFLTDQLIKARQTKSSQLGPTLVKSVTTRSSGGDLAVSACQDLTQSFVYVDGKKSARPAGFYQEVAVLHQNAGKWIVIQINGEQGKVC